MDKYDLTDVVENLLRAAMIWMPDVEVEKVTAALIQVKYESKSFTIKVDQR